MSARWLVGLRCDRCAEMYGAEDFQDRNNYLPVLRALRVRAAADGWTSLTNPGPRRHRDYCPGCAQVRSGG